MREDESNCAFIAGREGAIQQVVIMGLSDNDVVVEQACQIIGTHQRLAKFPALKPFYAAIVFYHPCMPVLEQ